MSSQHLIIGLKNLRQNKFFVRIHISGMGIVPTIFTLIAAVGMFGFETSFTKMRTRKISLQKLPGASSKHMFLKLVKEFIILIIIANIIFWKIETGINEIDLATYRIEMGVWDFIITGCIVMIISSIILFYPTKKTSVENL
ncbi:MAG: hypothetical protein KAQ62_21005 [Cyclobacteriaceae bacterium]|nr:hypothetical protein [Cyclobacteriaceae bacterium]